MIHAELEEYYRKGGDTLFLTQRVDEVAFLLRHGVSAELTDEDGNTLLHRVASTFIVGDDVLVAQLLVEHNAHVNAVNNENMTALCIACDKDNCDLALFLLSHGADPNACTSKKAPLIYAIQRHNLELVIALVSHGADPMYRTFTGATALHFASIYADVPMMEYLLDHGADVHARNLELITPLHLSNSEESARLLLQRGADLYAADNLSGTTPMQLAFHFEYRDTARCMWQWHIQGQKDVLYVWWYRYCAQHSLADPRLLSELVSFWE